MTENIHGKSAKPLAVAEVIAFNDQLTHLAVAGLPVEYGLRLIADDMKRGRLAGAIRALVAELEQGATLPEAFARHSGQFPPLYARIVEAGIRSNNLAGLLMNLGRHLETMRRLRAALWRAFAYPMMVLLFLAIVLVFVDLFVLPQFSEMYRGFASLHPFAHWNYRAGMYDPPDPRPDLPWTTEVLFALGGVLPLAIALMVLLLSVGPVLLYRFGRRSVEAERFSLRLPLVGPILRRSLISRWCDAAGLAVATGMDLPAAVRLASEAVHSPGLTLDGVDLAEHVEAGRPLDVSHQYALLPSTVPAAMQLASRTNSLSETLRSLSELYEKQCRLRLENLPAVLSPILLAVIALALGFVIIALVLPLVQIVKYVTG